MCFWHVPGKVSTKMCIERVSEREEGSITHKSADTAAVTLRLFVTLPVGSWLMRTDSALSGPNVSVELRAAMRSLS